MTLSWENLAPKIAFDFFHHWKGSVLTEDRGMLRSESFRYIYGSIFSLRQQIFLKIVYNWPENTHTRQHDTRPCFILEVIHKSIQVQCLLHFFLFFFFMKVKYKNNFVNELYSKYYYIDSYALVQSFSVYYFIRLYCSFLSILLGTTRHTPIYSNQCIQFRKYENSYKYYICLRI